MRRAFVSLCILVLLAAPAARAVSNDDLARYADQLFSRAYPAGGPGAAVLIVKDGQVVLRKGYGLANVELGVPMRPDMVFEIASLTKQFTAAAILLLQERGKLSVSDDITKYLPDYPTHGRTITIENLLSHTSGIPNVTSLPEWWPQHREDLTLPQLIALFKDKPLAFNPGERLAYSNSGYILLGAIIEKASGKSYEDFVEQEIFAPLGMKRSRYGHQNELVPDRATGYDQAEDGGYKAAEYISFTQAYAAGALLSTVDDLALWSEALTSEKLLRKVSLERMSTPAKLASGQPTIYAYGQGILEEDGMRIFEHGGGVPGFNSELVRMPAQHLVVIILANILREGPPPPPGLAYRVTLQALGKPVEERKAVALDPATLDDYVGAYRFDETTSRTITREGNRLFSQRTGGDRHEILPASRDEFFFRPEESEGRIRFQRDVRGKVSGMGFRALFGPDQTGVRTEEKPDAPPTNGQAEIPQTPAGKVFAAWLTAFNSGDPAQYRAFDAAYPRKGAPPMEDRLAFQDSTGGFTLLRVEKSEPLSLVVLLKENYSDTVARQEMTVSSDDPPKLLVATIEAVPRPPDLAIPRMTEAAALAALSDRAEELAKKDRFSGVLLVARHGQVLLQKPLGRANRETGAPVTLDTRFSLGSMNKMFTAVAILQLVEAGRIALDDPLGKYLTDYPNRDVASRVTVRHLLTHTGGTGDFFGPEFEKSRLTLREHADFLKLFGSRGLDGEPGQRFRYSNYGFILLGALIERVTGLSYYDYVRSRIFQPAGMTATDSLPESDTVPNRAVGYTRRGSTWVPNTDLLGWRGTAAGGGYSTAGDLLRFVQALESGKLISKALFAEATTQRPGNYGYGFEVRGEGALRNYGHSGGFLGVNGDLHVFPELGTVVISLGNLDPPAASRLADFFIVRMPAP
jgi:CubicO group peptidase (beta-lactamase class C family)